MTLSELKVGQTGRVAHLLGEGAVKRRIMEMGLTKGAEVKVRNYELSIRKDEAAKVELA